MKLPAKVISLCGRFWDTHISARTLFIAVLCCFPAFLFQRSVPVLVCETLLFLLLALSKRGSVHVLPSVLVIAGVTFFSLLSPYGKVLFRIGTFAVTAGALEGGLRRGLVLAGMVFLSQLAVSPRLVLPGRAGMFLSQMFVYLDELGGERIRFKRGRIISAIDERLCTVYDSERSTQPISGAIPAGGPAVRTSAAGYIIAAAVPAVLYSLFIFEKMMP